MSDLLEQKPEESSRKRNPKRVMALIAIGAIPMGIGILFIQVPIGCACGNPEIQATGTYLRSQEAYYLEHRNFSKSFESLKIAPIPATTTRYLFSTEVTGDRAYIYAIPRELPTDLFRLGLTKAEIAGLVGAVAYDKKRQATVSILCTSESNAIDKPPKPIFNGEQFTCPSGFAGSSRSGFN